MIQKFSVTYDKERYVYISVHDGLNWNISALGPIKMTGRELLKRTRQIERMLGMLQKGKRSGYRNLR